MVWKHFQIKIVSSISPLFSFALLGLFITFVRLVVSRRYVAKGLKELPGPKGWPIIGNFLEVPKTHSWIKFKQLGEKYGPIFKLEILGNTHVIISKGEIAEELLTLRGAHYSDRGRLHMLDLMTRNGDLLGSPNNEYWRRGRKFAGVMLNGKAAAKWEPFQAHQARRLAFDMIRDPTRYHYWLERYTTLVSIREGYGLKLKTTDEEEYHTKKILDRMHRIDRVAAPGAFLVNMVPWLLYLPEWIAPFKQEATRLYKVDSAYFRSLLDGAKEDFKNGVLESPPSFARCWLEQKDHFELTNEEILYVIGTMYSGGAGTTSGVMKSFVRAMCLYPGWQKKLHAEIDEAVGPDRVPEFSDLPRLPLVRAISKELLRWRPVVPGNQPHRVTKDDSYNGYRIPNGALVHGNQWAIHREEAVFPEPEEFNPDRWLNPDYSTYQAPLEQYPNLKRWSAFGFGRRICPGLETAERSLFIQIAMLGWVCHFSKRIDPGGKEIPIQFYDMENESPIAPQEFAFELKPRSETRLHLLSVSLNMESE